MNQRADWDEKLQLKTEYKRLKAGESVIRGEMKLAAKCLVEVSQSQIHAYSEPILSHPDRNASFEA